MSIGGGCSAEILASRIDDNSRLMSSTRAAAESPGGRSDQSFKVMKACAVFMPWPRKLKPVRNTTLSMPERFFRYSSTFSIAPSVRANDESDGVCTSVVMKP